MKSFRTIVSLFETGIFGCKRILDKEVILQWQSGIQLRRKEITDFKDHRHNRADWGRERT
jgi:hypothetical protein